MNQLIIGCGYLGARVGKAWLAQGHQVTVLTRRAERAAALAAEGFAPLVGDVARPDSLDQIAQCLNGPRLDTVLYALGYDRAAGASRQAVQVDGLAAALDRLPGNLGRIVFISTTGVYGTSDGSWIDEETAVVPCGESGRAAWQAEQVLARHPLGQRAVVLRMAGLYGPGRLPRLAGIRAGEPILADPKSYLNLIHIDDAVAVVLEAERRAPLPSQYLVSDGRPVTRGEYYGALARLVGGPAPVFERPPPGGEEASSRGQTNKRVRSARQQRELPVVLRYPSLVDGLAASLACDEPSTILEGPGPSAG